MKERKQTSDFAIDRIINIMPLSKVMRGIKLGVILSVALLLLTACGINTFPTRIETPTVTVSPSKTPLPTATLTPTATEDTFEGLEVCPDWKNPCPATEEDLISGRLIDFAKSVGQPFPKEAYNTGRLSFGAAMNGSLIGFDWNNIKGERPHPEQELYRQEGSLIVPYRWVMHFWVPYNGVDWQISIQQWLNTDFSVSYLQYVIDCKDAVYDYGGITPTNLLFEKVVEAMPLYQMNEGMPYPPGFKAISYADKERVSLMTEWEATGIIPEQLQYKILMPSISVNEWTKKLP